MKSGHLKRSIGVRDKLSAATREANVHVCADTYIYLNVLHTEIYLVVWHAYFYQYGKICICT